MQEIKFTSHKQYLFGLLFSIKVKEDSYRPKYTSSFLICLNLNDSQTFRSSSCKNFLPPVCIVDATCFDECFLFHVITGKRYFFQQVIFTVRFFQPPYCRFLKASVLKEVRILYYLQNNAAVLILMVMLSSKIKLSYTIIIHSKKNFRS